MKKHFYSQPFKILGAGLLLSVFLTPIYGYAHPCTAENMTDELQSMLIGLKYNPHNAELLMKIATEYERRNQPDEAVQYLDRYLTEHPDDLALTLRVAQTSYKLGFFPLAERHYKRALLMAPDKEDIHYQLGIIYSDLNEPDKAIQEFQTVLRNNPNDSSALANLGAAYLDARQLAEATSYLRKALQLDPQNPDRHNMLGLALLESKKYDDALASFQKAIALAPGKINYYYNLGEAYRLSGKPKQAMAEFHRAVQQVAETPDEFFNQGKIYYKIGLYDDAIRSYQQALGQYTDKLSQAQTILALGYAYEAKNDPILARQNYEKYLNMVSEGPAANDVRFRLKTLGH